MEDKLLRREQEFHRFNAELELKTQSLIKEVETVMSIQEHLNTPFTTENYYLTSPLRREADNDQIEHISEEISSNYFAYPKQFGSQSARSGSSTSLQSLKSSSVDKSSKKDIGDDGNGRSSASDSIIRVLQGKIKILQNEVNALKSDYRRKDDEYNKCQVLVKHLEEEKLRALSQATSLREQCNKRQVSVSDTSAKLCQKEAENASLKKEIENLKKELKSTSQTLASNDVRLNRALEEVDKLKNALKRATLQEKEMQMETKQNVEELSSMVKKLEKQKVELMHAFRQQVQLIENLKSQRVVYEANIMSKFNEDQFFELLDSGTTSNHTLQEVK